MSDPASPIWEEAMDEGKMSTNVDSSNMSTNVYIHDPLCWFANPDKVPAVAINDGWPCICDLIAKSRADEREKAAHRAELCVNKFKARDFNDGVDACVAAVRGESSGIVCAHNETPDHWEAGAAICRKCGCDVTALYEMGN